MKFSIFRLFFFLCLSLTVQAHAKGEYFLVDSFGPKTGMFAQFSMVMGFLDLYEKKQCAGVHVNFGQRGVYYDSLNGPNWWEYYCEPLRVGNQKGAFLTHAARPIEGKKADYIEEECTKEYVNYLIRKYVKFKPHIEHKVRRYVQKYFNRGFVIGVHYRGTDKVQEARRVSYEKVVKAVQKYVKDNRLSIYLIFVATDEEAFLERMREVFPGKVTCQIAMRSEDGTPIHMSNVNRYLQGEEALVDALLLSKTKILIRTSSNLSLWSTYFNPTLPVVLLNHRYLGTGT